MAQKSSAERLKKANLSATKHRVTVLNILMEAGRPLSHLEIQDKLEGTKIDRVTLYRILTLLKEASLIHQVQGNDGVWRFCSHDDESDHCPGGHPHFLCESCGKMICLTNSRMQHIQVPDGFAVTHKQMLILGVCDSCCQKAEKIKDENISREKRIKTAPYVNLNL